MAESSNIAWTRSTFNPWMGCTKVSPGCDHCYASVSTPVRTTGIQWGAGQPRRRTSAHNWNGPLKWNERAKQEQESGIITPGWESWHKPGFWPVFCASLGDVFDNEVDPLWRADLFHMIERTPYLTWLLLTKRIGNAANMMFIARGGHLPLLPNVWLGITVVNQREADRDIPKLLQVPAAKRFLSMEPLLGPINLARWIHQIPPAGDSRTGHDGGPFSMLDWVIVGGESDQPGMRARPFDVQWARSTVQQCRAAGVPVFVKQLGSNPAPLVVESGSVRERLWTKDRAGADPSEWPGDLRVQEFP